MGLWSKIKKAAKKVWRGIKAVVRTVVKLVVALVHLVIGGLGQIFFFWMQKRLRIHICILHPAGGKEVVSVSAAQQSAARAAQIIKDKFNTKLIHYGEPFVEVIKEDAPTGALDVECNFTGHLKVEFGEGGEFFAKHTAGWNAIPITVVHPVTVFVVRNITDGSSVFRGCSSGVLTDYVVITADGINDDTTLAHELGHAGFLLHRSDSGNLMYHPATRGTSITRWQRFWFRSSRHVNFW